MALADVVTSVLGRSESASPAGNRDGQPRLLLADYLEAVAVSGQHYPWQIRPADTPAGCALLATDPSLQAATVVLAVDRLIRLLEAHVHGHDLYALRALIPQLCRHRLPFEEADLRQMLALLAASNSTWRSWVPLLSIVKSIERWVTDNGLPPAIRAGLQRLQIAGHASAVYADERKALALVVSMLAGPQPEADPFEPDDDWGYAACEAFATLDDTDRAAWHDLLRYAATANGSKPTKPWLKRAAERIDAIGRERSRQILTACLAFMHAPARPVPDTATLPSSRVYITGDVMPTSIVGERNGNLLKGLAWCCVLYDDPLTASTVGDAAEACFKKIPNIGARSTKAGNACVYALGAMPGLHGVAQLQRLRQRVKQPSALSQIDAALEAAAHREGMTRDDLDDLAVPTFDLVDGRRRVRFGDYAADIVVVGSQQVDVEWYGPDGKPRKSEPSDIKRLHPDELKALKRLVDDVRKMLPAQRDRIERFLLTERTWSLADWRQRYLDHPLLSWFSRRLIWQFRTGDYRALGAWHDGSIVAVDDRPLGEITDETRVRLWHSIDADATTVEAWQDWLDRHAVTQPFKQAHREVYVLTDAELATETYSNRFAGHILRQHQLHALCQSRGWAYRLQGAWDGANNPTLMLPEATLMVEFWVEGAPESDAALSRAGVSLYVSTDQVRFRRIDRRGQPAPLTDIPTVVFSEVMRDVDLFVAVSSVGNDPTWADRGADRYGDYWNSFAFGDLSTSARTRRVVLERLLPRLKIASRCSLADKFLVVRGDLRTYKIHLGSGNVLMEPNNQYLCIVPSRGASAKDPAQGLLLPFEGDGMLTIILSKAFLLAGDTAITDPTIKRQIQR
ncbi:MAG TPA: DUF4132 domain-containing protein [Thermomicrobiales bacterium]